MGQTRLFEPAQPDRVDRTCQAFAPNIDGDGGPIARLNRIGARVQDTRGFVAVWKKAKLKGLSKAFLAGQDSVAMTVSLDQLVQGHSRVGVKDVDSPGPSGTRAIRLAGRMVSIVGGVGSTRRYLICPDCGARRWHLYLMPAPTCRVCAHLDYASDRISQRSRTLHAVIRLRRQIPGADPWPFGALPKRQRHSLSPQGRPHPRG